MSTKEAVNEKLKKHGLDMLPEVDKVPARTRYLKHLNIGDWDDKEWKKALQSLRLGYLNTFHDYFAEIHPYLRYEIGEEKVYWIYDEERGIYTELSASTAREYVMALLIQEGLQESATESFARNCLARYRAVYKDRGNKYDDFDAYADWFHASNGWVNLKTMVFKEHTPKRLSRRVSAVAYDKDAVCPIYDKFLDEDVQLKKDQVRVIDQFSGLTLTNEVKHGKMLTIIGKPGSGKSTLLDVWSHVLGDCATQKRLTELAGESFRFAGSDFVGRSLCWFDEVDVKRNDLSNTLGNLITGKKVRVERKGINGVSLIDNTVKCVLTANTLPLSSEHGMYRRLIFIPFTRSFYDDGTKINNILELMQGESSGILNRMIRGLQDLRKMQDFTVIEGHEDMIEQYKAQSDTIAEFLDTYFEPAGEEDMIDTKVLFDAYEHFMGGSIKGMVMTPQRFGKMFGSQPLVRFSRIKPVRTKTSRKWSCLRLADGFEFENVETKAYIKEKNIVDENW